MTDISCLLIFAIAAPTLPYIYGFTPPRARREIGVLFEHLGKQAVLPHGQNEVDHTEGNAITTSQQIPNH